MSLYDELTIRRENARKAHDSAALDTVQMILSAAKNEQITLGHAITDVELQGIIARQVKQLKDARQDFLAGQRNDLVAKNDAEISLLEQFLPKQLSDEELKIVITEVIGGLGSVTKKDAGQIMGKVMAKVKGQVDGNRVREMVHQLLPD